MQLKIELLGFIARRAVSTLLVLGLVMTSPLVLAVQQFTSGERQVVLLELFTSEGCSSCPPADKWISTLKTTPGLWEDFVPVAFHVDYWDWIGWKDRYAEPEFSARQRRYKDLGFARSVYTPGFFLGGEEWKGWFKGTPPNWHSLKKVGPLALSIEGKGVIDVVFSPRFDALNIRQVSDTGKAPETLQLHIALLGFDEQSPIRDGENTGKNLVHDFVVMDYRVVRSDTFTPASGPHTTAQPQTRAPYEGGEYQWNTKYLQSTLAKGIVAWVTTENSPEPLQATGGYLR